MCALEIVGKVTRWIEQSLVVCPWTGLRSRVEFPVIGLLAWPSAVSDKDQRFRFLICFTLELSLLKMLNLGMMPRH